MPVVGYLVGGINAAAAILIASACLRSAWLAWSKGPHEARMALTDGLVFAMSLMLGATLLNMIRLENWSSIGHFASIVALRLFIKGVIKAERGQQIDVRAVATRSVAHLRADGKESQRLRRYNPDS